MNIEEVIEHGSLYYQPETPEGRTSRFDLIVPAIFESVGGNIVEIGAGEGVSTKILLKIAKEYQRQVLVIDPWESLENQPSGYGQYSYRAFVEQTKEFTNLTVCNKPSFHKEVSGYMSKVTPIAFAFVDGLQYTQNVLSDLFLCSSFGVQVICVDDINRMTDISQVPQAVEKFLKGNNKYKRVDTPNNLIECYLIKLS